MDIKRAVQGAALSLVFILILSAVLGSMWKLSEENLLLGGAAVSEIPAVLAGDSARMQGPQRNWDVPDPDLAAETALSAEVNSLEGDKVLFAKNGALKLPVASLTKLMTAVVAIENYSLTQKIPISQKAVSVSLERNPLKQGSEMAVGDLLYIMLIESSNQAAQALSEGMGHEKFVEAMNQKAKDLGMKDTFFSGASGLSSKNISTAEDLLELAKYILTNHPEISDISRNPEYDLPGFNKLTNTDQLLGEIPDVVASKTGYTKDAKGCLFMAISNSKRGGYMVYIILGADDRFLEMKKLIQWANSAYIW